MYLYDVVAVLGYAFLPDWKLPPHVYPRLQSVANLYKQKKTNYIALCGKWAIGFEHQDKIPPTTEAEEMRKVLLDLGIPSKAILKEEYSRDTIGNAYFLKTHLVEPKRFHKILVVCADYHLLRVQYIFGKVFGNEYKIDYLETTTNLKKDKEFKKKQGEILTKQKQFLRRMKKGVHGYLKDKLYAHSHYKKKS